MFSNSKQVLGDDYGDVGIYLSVFTAEHAQPYNITIAIKSIQSTLLTNRLKYKGVGVKQRAEISKQSL